MKRFVCLDSDAVDITLGLLYAVDHDDIIDDVGHMRKWRLLARRAGLSPASLIVEVEL